ncbi:putative RNA binding protein YcfA (HicA-like mRNA interferase family) [Lactobacillus colini]|uniref:RNA binding protein YcfA (HicA-like mRNA interferase family) n=1 Tax=Lactobacillus colini TaxID=1819254 RepID=A0ABS4MBW0_9LACO|nr:putative RNA binding protein YcfA (HicA-like mRNA interferase family) [Lactobacillus colini]
MESRKIIKRLKHEGWFLARVIGDDYHFKYGPIS